MVRCNRKERDIHPHFDEGGDAGRAERIRARVWSHLCDVEQKRFYNDAMRSGAMNLSDPFNTRLWQAHHDSNLAYSLARIDLTKQRESVDQYVGWGPGDSSNHCQCAWRSSTGTRVEPCPSHPSQKPRPRITRAIDTQRQINAYQNDQRGCLQARPITANGTKLAPFAWPDTIRPLTLASFGKDADADWCLYRNPVKLHPVSMSKKQKTFVR